MRYLLVIALVTLLFSVSSQNNLRLHNLNAITFHVYFNDSLINEKPQAGILISNIKKDTIKIKIEFENKTIGEQTLYLLDKGRTVKNSEFDYLIELNNGKVNFTFTGMQKIIRLPDPIVPPEPVIDTMAKYRNNILEHYCEMKDGKPAYFNNLPKTGECIKPMPNSYLNYMNLLMIKTQIDDDKFNVAENTIRNNCLTVYQLNKILAYISFEIEKLKMIRLAYFHLTDKENKLELESTFKLESSKRELNEFFKNSEAYRVNTGVNCLVPSSESAVKDMYSKLTVYRSDAEKLMALKKIYTDYCYSIDHVKLIISLFIHDRERIDTSKLLFYYCTEKENFINIGELFSYTTSVADLKDFLDKQKN